MKSLYKYLLLEIFIIGIISCTRPINKSEIAGTYLNWHDIGYDSIIINTNGTFCHYYRDTLNQSIVDSGTWRYIGGSRETDVELSEFLANDRFYENGPPYSIIRQKQCRVSLFKSFGQIKLRYYIDDTYDYYKREK